jgi:ABC-type lipoprotein release transport system permease subunit
MSFRRLILVGLAWHWRMHAAMACGVMIAASVLAGALLVGHSVRGSLRDLAQRRLGNTHFIISRQGIFRADLAAAVSGVPVLALDGSVVAENTGRRSNRVQVYGVDERFWRFHAVPAPPQSSREFLISPGLAAELHMKNGEPMLLRLPRISPIPGESLHGRKTEGGKPVRGRVRILPAEQMGEFSLQAQQRSLHAVFLPLSQLNRELDQHNVANLILTQARPELRGHIQLGDLGLRLRVLDEARGMVLESDGLVLNDEIVHTALQAARSLDLEAARVITYLANTITAGRRSIPYSLVTATDLVPVPPGRIILNQWAARELSARPGSPLTLEYFLWDASGQLLTRQATFELDKVIPILADRDFAPVYPGISDVDDMGRWEPPFPIDLSRIRKEDEQYWDRYRTTPKAFVSIEDARRLWSSRFGDFTSIRLRGARRADFERLFLQQLTPERAGLRVENVRDRFLTASEGSTDFGEYFLYFSCFLVVAALLLAGLFFRLMMEQRVREIGLLQALGFPKWQIAAVFTAEALAAATLGALAGGLGAIPFCSAVLFGLRTIWIDAVGMRDLRLHVSWPLCLTAVAVVLLLAPLLISTALRRLTPRSALAGESTRAGATSVCRVGLVLLAAALGILAWQPLGPAARYFGGAWLLQASFLMLLYSRLAAARLAAPRSLRRLGWSYLSYRPNRTVLALSLIAIATFIVLSAASFERSLTNAGAGGYPLMAESALPILVDLNSPEGRLELALSDLTGVRFYPFRLRPGEDVSCLNLYQPSQPRILGVPASIYKNQSFLFTEPGNHWTQLEQELADGSIPAIADSKSLAYVLHRKIGDVLEVPTARGAPVRLRFVAALVDSVFQSEILISEKRFLRAFPEEQGFRVFLIQSGPYWTPGSLAAHLERSLADFGFDVSFTMDRLAAYQRVEQTYLATFQTLGALGLLLGAAGVGVVMMRNVLERRRELAILRAVGFDQFQIRQVIFSEAAALLLAGALVGAGCAALASVPGYRVYGGTAPTLALIALPAAILLIGLLSSRLALRLVQRECLLEALRSE